LAAVGSLVLCLFPITSKSITFIPVKEID